MFNKFFRTGIAYLTLKLSQHGSKQQQQQQAARSKSDQEELCGGRNKVF